VGTGILEGDLVRDAVGFGNIATDNPFLRLTEELGIIPDKTKMKNYHGRRGKGDLFINLQNDFKIKIFKQKNSHIKISGPGKCLV
jgi:hypothetical protein